MLRFLYNLVWPLGLLFFLPRYLVKMFRRGGYREKFGQRLGSYGAEVRQRLAPKGPRTWLHAVSVGEIAVALKLLGQLRRLDPSADYILTTTTTTAYAMALKRAPAGIEVMYMPLDFWPVMRRGLAAIRPNRIVLIEGEVWPNLMAFAERKKIPVALVNARLSPRSWQRFKKASFAVRPVFSQLRFIAVPEKEDVERWRLLAGDTVEIIHTGSVKFDPENLAGSAIPRRIFEPGVIVLFGGSTHRGEELALARIFQELRPAFPQLRLFLAPRHVERAREVAHDVANLGLDTVLVSSLNSNAADGTDCIVLDRTGELASWYQVATVVFVGKSLLATGGQNPVEPIIADVPVVFGPHMENFATLARSLVARHGAIQVDDEAQLRRAVEALLKNPAARAGLVAEAKSVVAEHRGATRRTAELIVQKMR